MAVKCFTMTMGHLEVVWHGRRTKALLALSCLVRHHAASLDAFRSAGGLRLLAAALGDGALRAKRKALQLLREVRHRAPNGRFCVSGTTSKISSM